MAIIITFLAVLFLSSVLAALFYTKTVGHQASISSNAGVQTYLDSSCVQVLNAWDWESFNMFFGNKVKSIDFYLRNEGNVEANVTCAASGFTSYNATEAQFETSSWILYLVDANEMRLKPQNDTSPYKLHLNLEQVIHLKFYLSAKESSPMEISHFTHYFTRKTTRTMKSAYWKRESWQ